MQDGGKEVYLSNNLERKVPDIDFGCCGAGEANGELDAEAAKCEECKEDRDSVIRTRGFPEHHDKVFFVSKEMPVSALKGPAKKAGVSLNDWVLGCAT
jgi:hypothetical protein